MTSTTWPSRLRFSITPISKSISSISVPGASPSPGSFSASIPTLISSRCGRPKARNSAASCAVHFGTPALLVSCRYESPKAVFGSTPSSISDTNVRAWSIL